MNSFYELIFEGQLSSTILRWCIEIYCNFSSVLLIRLLNISKIYYIHCVYFLPYSFFSKTENLQLQNLIVSDVYLALVKTFLSFKISLSRKQSTAVCSRATGIKAKKTNFVNIFMFSYIDLFTPGNTIFIIYNVYKKINSRKVFREHNKKTIKIRYYFFLFYLLSKNLSEFVRLIKFNISKFLSYFACCSI